MKTVIIFCMLCMSINSAVAAEVFGVTKVIDGHTMEISDGRMIRLIGVHTSSEESTEYLRQLVEGKGIVLDFDERKEDEEGRVFAYVVMIETFINATVLIAGYGMPESLPPNTKYDAFFQKLYEDAVRNKRGLWKQ